MAARTMTTTDRKAKRARWSKDAVRAIAWATGAATFLGSVAAIAVEPKPPAVGAQAGPAGAEAQRPIVERHVTRRIVVIQPDTIGAPVSVVQVPDVPASAPAVPAPAPAPVTSTGGS
jgi:hypothetical protein